MGASCVGDPGPSGNVWVIAPGVPGICVPVIVLEGATWPKESAWTTSFTSKSAPVRSCPLWR